VLHAAELPLDGGATPVELPPAGRLAVHERVKPVGRIRAPSRCRAGGRRRWTHGSRPSRLRHATGRSVRAHTRRGGGSRRTRHPCACSPRFDAPTSRNASRGSGASPGGSQRGASKWRCPTGKCRPASRWVFAGRLHPLVPRETPRRRKLYKGRAAVEREFGRLKPGVRAQSSANRAARGVGSSLPPICTRLVSETR
jgi:hypothetical protein